MKVVIDTNVLVSAALRDRDPEAVILFVIARRPEFEWVATAEIVDEYREVLARPKLGLLDADRAEWLALLQTSITLIAPTEIVDFPRDQQDAKFLAGALAAEADYFITGDRDFTEARKLVATTILSVSLFKKLLIDSTK